MKYDDCEKPDVKAQVAADHAHDRIREEGYWTPYDLYWVEQQEERARRLGYS